MLFNRVAATRPLNRLSPTDEALRAKFVSLESRLLYLQYGPDALASCPFCASDDPRTYLWYAVPALVAPHLLNLAVATACTSPSMAGRAAATWRGWATLAAVAAAGLDVWMTASYPHQANARIPRLPDLDMFYWRSRWTRCLVLALFDLALAGLVWLTSTNRAFASPPPASERVEAAARQLASGRSRLNALGILKNTATRDDELRRRAQNYWLHEAVIMREVMEDREVVDGVKDALENRISIQSITADADAYAMSVLQAPGMGVPSAQPAPADGSTESSKDK